MAKINVPEGEGMEAKRIWSLAPELGKAMGVMGEAVYTKTSITIREREVARMRIAQLNECHV